MAVTEMVAKTILSLQPLVSSIYMRSTTFLAPICSLLVWFLYGVSNDMSSQRASTTCDPSDHYDSHHFEAACLQTGSGSMVKVTRLDGGGDEDMDLSMVEFNPMLLLGYTLAGLACLALNKMLIDNYLLSTAMELPSAPDSLLDKVVEHFCKFKKLYRTTALKFFLLVERLPLIMNLGYWAFVDWFLGKYVGFGFNLVLDPSLLMFYLPDAFKCVYTYSSYNDREAYGENYDSTKCLLPLNKSCRAAIVLLYLIMAGNILLGVTNFMMRLVWLCLPCERRRQLMGLTGQADGDMQAVAVKLVKKMSFDELFHLEAIARNIPQHKRFDFLSSVSKKLYPSGGKA